MQMGGEISDFTGRIKGMHVFIGNFTYVIDFMIIEDISSIIDPRISDSSCIIDKGVKNDIEPIAPIMTVNRLVLEWEERIKVHLEKEMKFNQWMSNNFKNKQPTPVKVEGGMDDKGEVT
ncbi:hypothetical protein Tco_1369566 [Tanacetum coccineum]